ncbi:DUF4240 domain-containing protein, partial [Nonomuraea sp. RK-328]|nr:DUF4240 domain-containing protein [Nonomuraea sp. RK-328]
MIAAVDIDGFWELVERSARETETRQARVAWLKDHLSGLSAKEIVDFDVLTQLRYRQLDRAGAGVPVARPVAVAAVGPLLASFVVGGSAQAVGLGRHQRLGHGLDHGSQHVGVACLDLLRQPLVRRHTVVYGHRSLL